MLYLTNTHPIIKELYLKLFTINIRLSINTKSCTQDSYPPCLPPLPMWNSDIIIFFLKMLGQISEGTANTWYFSEKLEIKVHHTNLKYSLWCVIIFTISLRMLLEVTHQWPINKRQWLVNVLKSYIGKLVVQNFRY